MIKRIFLPVLLILISQNIFSLDIKKEIIDKGSQLIGSPYRTGGANPSGFDCSGLVNYLYKPHVPSLPRTASQLSRYGTTINKGDLSAGDLVFYATGVDKNEITHVGIYIGQNTLIQAVSAGPSRGVVLTDLDEKYWKSRFKWIKRVVPEETEKKQEEININYNKGNYSGTASNNEPEGNGQMIMVNGDVYKGEFHNGRFHGKGEYHYSNGDVYIGNFENGFESDGEIVKSDGSRYSATRDSRGNLVIGNRIDRSQNHNNYLINPDTSWDNWLKLEGDRFEARKKAEADALNGEKERFEEWKKNNG